MKEPNLNKEVRIAENDTPGEVIENADVEKRVAGIIAKHVDDGSYVVKTESKLGDDLGLDSLDSVELIMSLEEEFHVEIPDEDTTKMKTVGDVVQYIKTAPEGGHAKN